MGLVLSLGSVTDSKAVRIYTEEEESFNTFVKSSEKLFRTPAANNPDMIAPASLAKIVKRKMN